MYLSNLLSKTTSILFLYVIVTSYNQLKNVRLCTFWSIYQLDVTLRNVPSNINNFTVVEEIVSKSVSVWFSWKSVSFCRPASGSCRMHRNLQLDCAALVYWFTCAHTLSAYASILHQGNKTFRVRGYNCRGRPVRGLYGAGTMRGGKGWRGVCSLGLGAPGGYRAPFFIL